MHTCEVCCESFNKSNKSEVKCPYCPYMACTGCSERYLCDTAQDAHCMACKKGGDREGLMNNFTSKFVTQVYKRRREELLFDRERSLMPATQPYVEIELRVRKLNSEIHQQKRNFEQSSHRVHQIQAVPASVVAVNNSLENELEGEIWRMREVFAEQKKGNEIRLEIHFLEWQRDRLQQAAWGGAFVERRAFVRACPYTDCKGFLSTAWKCGLCEKWTCPECHEGRGPDRDAPHTRDPPNLETARLLERDSRPCPKCAALIFKIDGCDQMWCTQCHTAFSWRRGTIETSTVHNPHYYDYMRRQGHLPRNPGDVPCGGLPGWHGLVVGLRLRESPWFACVAGAHRAIAHTQHVLIPRYTTNIQTDNRDLRIKYMLKDINDDEFKKKIQQREKARLRKADIRQVCEMVVAVLTDLFQVLERTKDLNEFVHALMDFRVHVNTTLRSVSHRWSKCTVPNFNPNFDFV